MNILEQIVRDTHARVADKKRHKPTESVYQEALALGVRHTRRFERALRAAGMGFICEVKKASPSKGVIAEDFEPLQIAFEYQEAGASCISCLTEPKYFLGSDAYLQDIAKSVDIPVLRKDFVVDSYMIYEAKILGADAVLLISAILESTQMQEYIEIAHSLGLCALVETHNEEDMRKALDCKARIIGINNRDLRDFKVDIHTSLRLKELVPQDKVLVSESGIRSAAEVGLLESSGFDAVLVGESLMRTGDKKRALQALRGVEA